LRWHDKPITLYWSLLGLVLVTFVNFALVYVAAVTCFPQASREKGTNYGPIAGVLQDQSMMTLLALIVIWLPAVVFAHVPSQAKDRWLSIPFILFGFMFLVGDIFCWILRYNTRHAAFRRYALHPVGAWPDRKRYPLVPWRRVWKLDFLRSLMRSNRSAMDDKEWAAALEAHITLQNLVSVSMVAIALIPLIAFLKQILLIRGPD